MTDRIAAVLRRTLAGFLLAAVALLTPTIASAQVRTFNFVVDGFAEGATLTGTFSGTDVDGNGFLVFFGNGTNPPQRELSAFSAVFSGNSRVAASTFGFSDLNVAGNGLVYNLSGGSLGGSNSGVVVGERNGNRQFEGGSGVGAPCDGIATCFGIYSNGYQKRDVTTSIGTVTAAPGAPAPLLGVGLLPALAAFGALGMARRQRTLRTA